MSAELAVELFRSMLSTALTMVLPMLATAVSVGVSISLLQALTSIQEQTLAFVPKLVAVVGVMIASAFWLVEKIMIFTIEVFRRIPDVAGG